ncbi:hypothetical protein [Nocardioides jensenii]|uniref:hypothetical protein n=1 Tax=Nocardioides jensenii TaxID=1843 RepID=UPI0008343458|nr:hypothetical protein [Nocardioides jensenii]
MNRRGDHGTMAERVAATRRNAAPVEPHPGVTPDRTTPALKHCWYAGPHGRQAALLIEWRQVSPGADWEGNIAVAAPDGEGWAIVTMWVSSGLLARVSD